MCPALYLASSCLNLTQSNQGDSIILPFLAGEDTEAQRGADWPMLT